MASPHTLLTDGAHDAHIAFWTSVLDTIDDDFHFRQPWLSYAATAGTTVRHVCTIPPATAALIEELGRGQDFGVFVVAVGAVSILLHTNTKAAVVAIDSAPLAGDLGTEVAADDDPAEPIPLVTT